MCMSRAMYARSPIKHEKNMNIYFDTEFTDFLIDPALISIGFVADDGQEFYVELNDTYDESMCSWFVIENVLPILWGKDHEMSIEELAPKLKAWIESFDEPVTLWADAPSYDWGWLHEIFDQSNSGWPANLVRKCRNTLGLATSRYNYAYEDYWQSNKGIGAVRHHALWDARCIRFAHQFDIQK